MPRGIKYETEEERKAAIADYRKRYNKSEQGKAKRRRYFQSEKGKAAVRKYFQSEKGKTNIKRYLQSEPGKASRKKYNQSEKGKAKTRRYFQSEKGKAAQKAFGQTEKGKILSRKKSKKYSQTEIGQINRRKRARKFSQTEKGKKTHARGSRKHYHKLKTRPEKFAEYKFIHNLRGRVRSVMRQKRTTKVIKSGASLKLFGCTRNELSNHIENLFKPEMTWKNYGDWHVDHIKPLIKFNLYNFEERCAAFHYTNLQPLWGYENLRKGSK